MSKLHRDKKCAIDATHTVLRVINILTTVGNKTRTCGGNVDCFMEIFRLARPSVFTGGDLAWVDTVILFEVSYEQSFDVV